MVGYSREDIDGGRLNWGVLTPPEWNVASGRAFKQVEQTGRAAPFERECFRKDGRRVPVLMGMVATGESGLERLCLVIDLSERREAEKDLDRMMIERCAMLDSVGEGICGIDVLGRCTFINTAAMRMLGYSNEECEGQNVHNLLHSWHAPGSCYPVETCPIYRALKESGAVEACEEVFWRRDGSPVRVEYGSFPIVVNGRIEGSVISFRDITGRKKAEQSLRESEERFHGAFAHAAAGMCITNLDGKYLEVNRAFCRMTGYSEAELLAGDFQSITHPDDMALSMGYLGQLLRKEIPGFVSKKRYLRKDGSVARARCSVAALTDEAGNPVRFVTIVEGIGDPDLQYDVEEQLRQVQKMEAVGQLAGSLAHDFNNLLTVILGYSGVLERKMDAGDPFVSHVIEIKTAAERAADLTQQFLSFSRKSVSESRAISPNDLIRELQSMLRRLVGEGVELEIRLDPDAQGIEADPLQLEQVILNLAFNARDAMPRGGRLLIESARHYLDAQAAKGLSISPGTYLLLTFRDSGCGMDEPTKARLFEPFFTTKEPGVGTGLGLSTVWGIVKQNGGTISVASEVNAGTSFTIYLPLLDVEGAVDSLAPETGAPGDYIDVFGAKAEANVLVVDDDDQVRSFLAGLLEQEGYTVQQARNGRDAQECCQRSLPDAVIMDLFMPEQEGLETIRFLVQKWPHLPVIAISGVSGGAFLELAKKLGADAAIRKPFDSATILREVRRLTSHLVPVA